MKRQGLLVAAASALAMLAGPATPFAAGVADDPTLAEREALYGEVPLAAFAAAGKAGYPWTSLRTAAAAIAAGDHGRATPLLARVATDTHLEPLMRLEAWTALRQLGVLPTASDAAKLEGVVVEVIQTGGARHAGRVCGQIGHLHQPVRAARSPSCRAPPSYRKSMPCLPPAAFRSAESAPGCMRQVPPLPYSGGARLTILTAWGVSFGQGPIDNLARDPRSRTGLQRRERRCSTP